MFALLISLLLLQLLLLQLCFDLKGHSVMTWKNPKCITLYIVKLPVIRKMFLFF